jgi:polysaccharide export outer membrane protein
MWLAEQEILMRTDSWIALIVAILMAAPSPVLAQGTIPAGGQAPVSQTTGQQNMQVLPPAERNRIRLSYTLGPNDQVLIRVPEAEEITDKAFRIDAEGNLTLPVVGPVRAEGVTVEQLEADLTKQLSQYYKNPRITISVIQFRSDPVIFVGAFKNPGIYPLQGDRTLVEMLTVAGGLADNASNRLRITRRLEWGILPFPSAVEDPERNVSYIEISINRLMETVNPEEDLLLRAYDVVRVGTEELIYVTGEGIRSGAFPLSDKDSLSVMQIVAMSGGLTSGAEGEKAKVMRQVLSTARRSEIPLNVADIMTGKANDFPLLPNDILVVPKRKAGVAGFLSRYAVVAAPALVTSLIFIVIRRN